jgi:tRNA A37 methylthiotransferase MiaB
MEIVNERSKKIHELVRSISLEKNKKYMQKVVSVFVDEVGKGKSYIGRTMSYRPVVIESENDILGKVINVEITDVKSNFVIGKIKI